jgi:hypothetical protein
MGGQAARPPTLDVGESKKITQADYDLKIKNTPQMVETTGKAGREEDARAISFALQGFTNPASIVYSGQMEDLREKNAALTKQLGTEKNTKKKQSLQKQIAANNAQITKFQKSDPVGDLKKAFRGEFRMRDNLLGDMRQAGKSSKEYTRMQRALQKGLTAQQVKQRSAKADQAQTAQMGRVADVASRDVAASRMGDFGRAASRDIAAGQVGAGALGQTLMGRATQMAQSDGRLSAQADRDAVQSSRQGMAARGMATGSAALGAELLNRDRYSRQRQFEDLGFAQGVQGQDLTRQFQNVGNQLAASQSNQAAAMQAELANFEARYNAAVQNGNWEQAAAIQNQSSNLTAAMANQQTAFNTGQFNAANQQATNLANMGAMNDMRQFNTQLASGTDQFNALQRRDTQQFNIGALQSSALATDNERARQLGLGQSAYNFALQTNPKLMLAGLGSPYANFTPQALGLMNNTNVAPIYTGGQQSSPGAFQTIMGTAGQFAQAGGQAYAASASDRRMKKDIKQTGKDGLLGLKTYEYRFKGESKDSPKHRGFMAQEVQKVLPEAVEEFDYKGKKRLAIKPGVIGQAMAEMLAEQQKNMFADGYVVGAGAGA